MNPLLVVGAGPVGLTMAAELSRYRVPVRVIDKAAARTDKSKALAVWSRTLELLARSGCDETFIATGLKANAVNICSGHEQIARISFDDLATPYSFALMIPQSETERVLEEQLGSLGVQVERGVELTQFSDDGSCVRCSLRHADGRTETIETDWLIGCDGAHSTVRHQLGMEFAGDTLRSEFILADVHIVGLTTPTDTITIFWHHEGALIFFPITPGRYRVIADVGEEARHDPTLAEVQAIIDRRGPGGITLTDPVWLAGFGINERKVKEYRRGRVFVAGDAAHVHSPAGGQGMNTGMQDAFNLAWKLALVVHGVAAPSLLDTYSAERSPVAEHVLAQTGRLTRVAMARNELVQTVRNFVAHHVMGLTAVRQAAASNLTEISLGYPDSPLNAGSAHGLNGPAPGQRLVEGAPFGAGDSPRFALLAQPGDEANAVLQRHAALLESSVRTPPDAQGIWLVRPDGYVAAASHANDWKPIHDVLSRIG